jgi:hypothetical protein
MPQQILEIARITDAELIQALKNVAAELQPSPGKLWVTLIKEHQPIETNLESIESDPSLEPLLKEHSALIYQIRMDVPRWQTTLSVIRKDDQRSDELHLSYQANLDKNNAVRLLVSIRKHFRLLDSIRNVERVLGPEIAEFYAKREEGLHRLEQLTGQIIQQNDDYRRKLELQHEERLTKLEAQFEERRLFLETELQKKGQELAEKEAELVKKSQELDDRSSRHARRQLRQDLKKVSHSEIQNFN